MEIYQLGNIENSKEFLKGLGVHGGGVSIMANKMELLFFFIKGLKTPAINILKQDALSIGADLAVPAGVITCEKGEYNSLLIGTRKHIEILSYKELAQPFGLRNLAKELRSFLNPKQFPIEVMGVINANSDSFYKGSRFKSRHAILKIEQMIKDGATIIDIGGVSSRPNAKEVSVQEELKRIKPICDMIKEGRLYEQVTFSIDSHTPEVIEYALKSGFKLVNDITGVKDGKVVELAVKYGAKVCIMHMQGTPQTMQTAPHYSDVVIELTNFFKARIDKALSLGLKRENIILDVGIGFGKTLQHNIALIQNIVNFKRFEIPILIGASRKSLIDDICPTPIEERLAGTLAIHLKAIEGGANIIRCHDVKEHIQAIKVWQTLSTFKPIN